jgi:hypothetical protein
MSQEPVVALGDKLFCSPVYASCIDHCGYKGQRARWVHGKHTWWQAEPSRTGNAGGMAGTSHPGVPLEGGGLPQGSHNAQLAFTFQAET